jgi:hypothetical protein
MSASDFIRKQSASMAPADVVKAGAAAGLKFSRNLVYAVRGRSAGGGRRKGAKRRGRRTAAAVAATGREAQFRQLVLDLGIARSRALLAQVEDGMRRLIAGG